PECLHFYSFALRSAGDACVKSAQVSSPELFDEMVAHPPGKSDVGQRRILLGIGWKHGGVADKQIGNLMSLVGKINDRSLRIPSHPGCPDPMIGIDLKTFSSDVCRFVQDFATGGMNYFLASVHHIPGHRYVILLVVQMDPRYIKAIPILTIR